MIVYLVFQNSRKTPYKRILLGLSISDIIASITWILAPFLQPADSSQRVWAHGTDATCAFLGFMMQISFAAVWYNGMLSFYYLLTVRFRVKSSVFATRYEPWIHIFSVGFNLIAGIVGVSKGYYAEMELSQGCYIAEFPEGCEINGGCTGHIIGWIVSGVPVVILFTSILVNNAVIYCYVRRTTHRTINKSMQGRVHQNRRIQAVATQALLYVGTFLLAYAWAFGIRVAESLGVQAADEARIYPVLVLSSIFLPLQGVFNLLVYSRPNYLRIRQAFPRESRLFALHRAWFGGSKNRIATSVDGTLWSRRGGGLSASLRTDGGGGSAVPDVEKVRLRVSQQFSATFSGRDPLRRDIRIRDPFDLASVTGEAADQTNTSSTGDQQQHQVVEGTTNSGDDHAGSWNKEQNPLGEHDDEPRLSLSSEQENPGVLGLVMQDDGTPENPQHLEEKEEEEEDFAEPSNSSPRTMTSEQLVYGVISSPAEATARRYPAALRILPPQHTSMAMEEYEDPDEVMIDDCFDDIDTDRMVSSTTTDILQMDDSNRVE